MVSSVSSLRYHSLESGSISIIYHPQSLLFFFFFKVVFVCLTRPVISNSSHSQVSSGIVSCVSKCCFPAVFSLLYFEIQIYKRVTKIDFLYMFHSASCDINHETFIKTKKLTQVKYCQLHILFSFPSFSTSDLSQNQIQDAVLRLVSCLLLHAY